MPIHHISDLNDPRVAIFRDVTDPELMRKHGLFVAEGRLVVERLLETPAVPDGGGAADRDGAARRCVS